MKLAYERPMMRAQEFRANAYCAGCERVLGTTSSIFKVKWDSKYYYFDTNPVSMRNPNNGNTQYYFNEHAEYKDASSHDGNTLGNADGVFYLEFSNSYLDFLDTHYLYQENSDSGYGASKLDGNRPAADATVKPGSGVGLQVNSGDNGWCINTWANKSNPDNWWYSDDEKGRVSYAQDTVLKYIMSY